MSKFTKLYERLDALEAEFRELLIRELDALAKGGYSEYLSRRGSQYPVGRRWKSAHVAHMEKLEDETKGLRTKGADFTCPLMTGIFFNLVAGAAEEQLAAGQPPVAPYWRVVLEDGTLSPKTPAGPEQQAERLREEGHSIIPRRTKLQVENLQRDPAS